MQQKTIWTQLLLIGTAFSFIVLNSSCSKDITHFSRDVYYKYYNQSSYELTIVPYAQRGGDFYHLNPNDSMTIISNLHASVPLIFAVDSLFILLNDSIKIKYYKSDTISKSNILYFNNYIIDGPEDDVIEYIFTDKDFELY